MEFSSQIVSTNNTTDFIEQIKRFKLIIKKNFNNFLRRKICQPLNCYSLRSTDNTSFQGLDSFKIVVNTAARDKIFNETITKMENENHDVCEKIINDIDAVFSKDPNLWVL